MLDNEETSLTRNIELTQVISRNIETPKIIEIISELLKQNADINFRNACRQYNTPLHLAAKREDVLLVEFLLQNGADPKCLNGAGKTAENLCQLENVKNIFCNYSHNFNGNIESSHSLKNSTRNDEVRIKEISDGLVQEPYEEKSVSTIQKIDFNNIRNLPEECFKILHITNCSSTDNVIESMTEESFYSLFNKSPYWFIIIVELNEESAPETINIKQLESYFDKDKPVIIQWGYNDNYLITYRDQYKDLFYTLNQKTLDPIDSETLTSENFDFKLLLGALKGNLGGSLIGNILDCIIEKDTEFDSWRLVDYAAMYDDSLSLRFLAAVSRWDYTKVNSDGYRTLEIGAAYGNPSTISAILDLPFYIPEGEIKLSASQENLLNLRNSEGHCPLYIAAKAEHEETLRRLIRLNCGRSVLKQDCVDLAYKNKLFKNVQILLDEDAPFPRDFSEEEDQDLKKIAIKRENFHKAIIQNDESYVFAFIKSNSRLRNAYSKNNDSALQTAIKNRNFNMVALLQSKGFDKNAEVDKFLSELRDDESLILKHANLKYFTRMNDCHNILVYLLTKSRLGLGQEDHLFFDKIKSWYQQLVDIEEVSLIFQILEHAENLEIVFDFKNDSVANLNPTLRAGDTKGSCDYKSGRLYISGKRSSENELIGTIAHEFTHQAMQIRFNNDCNPFEILDIDKKMEFEKIVQEYKEKTELDEIITRVYTVYGESPQEWPSELIVRVIHILACYPREMATSKLEQASELTKWYEKNVVPEFKFFLKNPQFYLAQNRMQRINNLCGTLPEVSSTATFIKFNESRLLPDYLFNKQNFYFLLSPESKFTLMNLYQRLSEESTLLQLSKRIIFATSNYFLNNQTANDMFELMQSTINPHLVIDCINSSHIGDVAATINSITCKRNVLLVVKDDAQYKKFLENLVLKKGLDVTDHKIIRDGVYSWGDLSPATKSHILKQQVNFQNSEIFLGDIITAESTSAEFLKLSELIGNDKPMDIHCENIPFDEYEEERLFHHHVIVNENIFNDTSGDLFVKSEEEFVKMCEESTRNIHWIEQESERNWIWRKSRGSILYLKPYICQEFVKYSLDHFLDMLDSRLCSKIILVSDIAGMGKSTFVLHAAKIIKQRRPNYWIIRIELNDFTDVFKKHLKLKFNEPEDAITFVAHKILRLTTPFEIALFTECFQKNSFAKLILIFDGFDEISPTYKEFVLELLKRLSQTEITQMWITTRPNLIDELEDTFNTFRYSLETFSRQNQINCLKRFWYKSLETPTANDVIERFADELVDKMSQSFRDSSNQLIAMPLLTKLLAEIYIDHVKKLIETNATTFSLPKTLQLSQIFKTFILKKFELFQSQKAKLDSSKEAGKEQSSLYFKYIKKIHQILGMQVIFGKEKHEELKCQKVIEEFTKEQITRVGLITIDEHRTTFINRTFAEFFVAEFFIYQLRKQRHTALNIQSFFMKHVFLLKEYEVIRSFLNGLLREDNVVLTLESVSDQWESYLTIDSGLMAIETMVRENTNEIFDFTFTALVLKCKDAVMKILTHNELWCQAAVDGNIRILGILQEYAVQMKLDSRRLSNTTKSIWCFAPFNGQIPALKLLREWNKGSDGYKGLLEIGWRNSAYGGHIHLLELIYVWYMEDFRADFKKVLVKSYIWEKVTEHGRLNILEKFKHWNNDFKISNDELRDILLESCIWQCAVDNNHIDILIKLWQWGQEIDLTDEEKKQLLLDNPCWWIAVKNGSHAIVKLFITWCNQIGVNAGEKREILMDSEVWEGQNQDLQELIWEWGQSGDIWRPNRDDFKTLFSHILSGADADKCHEMIKKLWQFSQENEITHMDLKEMCYLAWENASYNENVSMLKIIWNFMEQINLSEKEKKDILLNPRIWEFTVREGHLTQQEQFWHYCSVITLTPEEFKGNLIQIWRAAAFSGYTFILDDLWQFFVDKVKEIVCASNIVKTNIDHDFDENCLDDEEWWRQVYDGKIDVLNKLMRWADGQKLTDDICKVLEVGSVLGSNTVDGTSLMKDTVIDTSNPKARDRFVAHWNTKSHAEQTYGFAFMRRWWKIMKDNPEMQQNTEKGKLESSMLHHGRIMQILQMCGEHIELNYEDVLRIVSDCQAWKMATTCSHLKILRKLYKWQVDDLRASKEITRFNLVQALRVACCKSQNIFDTLRVTGTKFHITKNDISDVMIDSWSDCVKEGDSTALYTLFNIATNGDFLNFGTIIPLLTDVDLWRYSSEKGASFVIDAFLCLGSHMKVDMGVFIIVLLDIEVWHNFAKGDFIPVFEKIWYWLPQVGLLHESALENLCEAWRIGLENGCSEILQMIIRYVKESKLSLDKFSKIFDQYRVTAGQNLEIVKLASSLLT